MFQDRMQEQRFERKYFITERQALEVRNFVNCYLEPDGYSAVRPEHSYPVHSLYLDSDGLTTYWATVHCEMERFKLRLRYYDEDPNTPVFFELKRRVNECILKQRAAVCKSAAPALVAGHFPEAGHLVFDGPNHLVTVQKFCQLVHELSARPKVHVAYEREAWVHPQTNSIRVTMDRRVCGEPQRRTVFRMKMARPVFPFTNQVVLELKYTDRFPDWFRDLVYQFNLVQTGAPKYCGSVLLVGEERLGVAAVPDAQPGFAMDLTSYV